LFCQFTAISRRIRWFVWKWFRNWFEIRQYRCPVVNFINILRAAFALKKLQSQLKLDKSCAKHFGTKKACIKCWWNWHLKSISQTIYKQFLRQNPFEKTKLRKTFLYKKAAHVILVKLTLVVNFTHFCAVILVPKHYCK